MNDLSSHIHHFEAGSQPDRSPLLLMHGTGGDETQLLQFGRQVAPGHPLLSVRGRVLEDGNARFFRRNAEGVFDEVDLRHRAAELAAFVAGARNTYSLPQPIAVGRSNGANMAAAVLLLHPELLAGAALLRAVEPLSAPPVARLDGKRVLIVSGEHDDIAPLHRAKLLAEQLSNAGASVHHQVFAGGHDQSPLDAEIVREWLRGFDTSTGPVV
jgi:phospholipase/carboxylesterase